MTDEERQERREQIACDQEWLQELIDKTQKTFDWVNANTDKLVGLGVSTSAIGGQVSLLMHNNGDNRETVLAIIKTFPGKWKKSAGRGTMTYILPPDNDNNQPQLTFTTHALPPSCKVEAVTITTPAQPESTNTELRVVCKTGKEDEL